MAVTASFPRCGRCNRPAAWNPVAREFYAYCSKNTCTSRVRICGSCSNEYDKTSQGAGSKYCATCKASVSLATLSAGLVVNCAWCGSLGGRNPARTPGKWPFICVPCVAPIQHLVARLKAHNVPHTRAKELLTDPGCEICTVDIVAKHMNKDGQIRPLLVVDHDHGCCPVTNHSCGRCLRGLICSTCNSAIGMLRNDPRIASGVAAYLLNEKNIALSFGTTPNLKYKFSIERLPAREQNFDDQATQNPLSDSR